MHNTPDLELMGLFGTAPTYRDKLAGADSLVHRVVSQRFALPPEKVASALPWGGRLSCMLDSAEVAWQVGELMAKQAGIGGAIAGGAKDLAVNVGKMPFQGAAALWRGTSAATKAKAGLVGAGLGVGALGLGAGHLGSKAIGAVGDFTRAPEEEHVAHVLSAEELEKQALNIGAGWAGLKAGVREGASMFGKLRGGGVRDAASAALSRGRSAASAASKAHVGQQAEKWMQGVENKGYLAEMKGKPITPKPTGPTPQQVEAWERKTMGAPPTGKAPPPAPTPQVQPPPTQNVPAAPQQGAVPTGQPPAQTPPTGTSAQKGQQAAVQSANQGAAAVQTPQEAGKTFGQKVKGALPWVAGAAGLGVAGVGLGAGMLANRGAQVMNQEGQLPNTYQGYGAPITGSASPYGYVSGP